MVAAATNKKNFRNASAEGQFPGKLHDMMTFVEANGLEDIICWSMNGYGIKINDPEKLVTVLPLFFSQSKYRSFRRQLNMWHFQRILDGPNKNVFVHVKQYFVRHDRSLCSKMSRHLRDMDITPLSQESRLAVLQQQQQQQQQKENTPIWTATTASECSIDISPDPIKEEIPSSSTVDIVTSSSLPFNTLSMMMPQQQQKEICVLDPANIISSTTNTFPKSSCTINENNEPSIAFDKLLDSIIMDDYITDEKNDIGIAALLDQQPIENGEEELVAFGGKTFFSLDESVPLFY